jgi:hypothetical protein
MHRLIISCFHWSLCPQPPIMFQQRVGKAALRCVAVQRAQMGPRVRISHCAAVWQQAQQAQAQAQAQRQRAPRSTGSVKAVSPSVGSAQPRSSASTAAAASAVSSAPTPAPPAPSGVMGAAKGPYPVMTLWRKGKVRAQTDPRSDVKL